MKYIYDEKKLPRPVLSGHDDWKKLYYTAWELAFKNVEYIEKEGWQPQMTCMPGVNTVWQWDSCLMVFITNYSNGTISALANLDNLYRLRRESDGYMSMAYRISTEKEAFGERINPPLMAWAEWEHYLVSGDTSRFEKVLPALEGCYSFIENHRRRPCGLYRFEDPGSSGMDNAPRGGYPAVDLLGSDVCHVDLGFQQAMSAKYIGYMYEKLGNTQKAQFYKDENRRICELINKLHWSDKGGFYYDFFARGEANAKVKLINIKTAAAFWCMLAGAVSCGDERLEAFKSHLTNENEFATKVPFPSLSADDLNYDATGGYWLGGVWAPTNFAAIRGLYETGDGLMAHNAAIKYLDAVTAVANDESYGSIWEVYSPSEYKPSTREEGTLCRKDFVGWSGIAPITMLIENIIGLHFNAQQNTVDFDIMLKQPCGLENMIFNGAPVSVVCTKYSEKQGETEICVTAEKPFVLNVTSPSSAVSHSFNVASGNNIFKI